MSSAKKKRQERQPPSAADIAAKRSHHRSTLVALAKLDHGGSLNQKARIAAAKVLRDSLNGIDARRDLGVAPARGRPETHSRIHHWIAADYLLLRKAEPVAKRAVEKIAARWGVSQGWVHTCARSNYPRYAAELRRLSRKGIPGSTNIDWDEIRTIAAEGADFLRQKQLPAHG